MSASRTIHNLVLIGFMGTGKSSVGRMAATHLHFRFLDTDELIESRAARSIADIFAQAGEQVFRGIEKQVVAEHPVGGRQNACFWFPFSSLAATFSVHL